MPTKPAKRPEDPAYAVRHCLERLPYRAIVFARLNQDTPLYIVAGSVSGAMGAEKALKTAHKLHGGNCFYCGLPVKPDALTIDHAEPVKLGGKGELQNLLIACRACNLGKGHRPIEVFKPDAGREWLSALLAQVQDRLNRIT